MIQSLIALLLLTGSANAQQPQPPRHMPPEFRALQEEVFEQMNAKLVCSSKLNAAQDQIAKLKEELEALKAKK